MDKDILNKLEKNLNEIIMQCLYCGHSDPLYENLVSATKAYKSLKMLNLNISAAEENDIIKELSGDNMYD